MMPGLLELGAGGQEGRLGMWKVWGKMGHGRSLASDRGFLI